MVPLFSKSISGSVWKKIVEYKHADYDLPLLIFGDFYSSRKEEQNKFLLDVRVTNNYVVSSHCQRSLTCYIHYFHSPGWAIISCDISFLESWIVIRVPGTGLTK